MENTKKGDGILKLVVVLGLITFVCALLLGVVNQITKPMIDQNEINTRNEAMSELIANAEFEGLEVPEEVSSPADKNAIPITGVYKATVDGQPAGYCVEVQPKGFGGAIKMMVGINADATVAGIKVTSHAETPGLGAKAQSDAEWVKNYQGKAADGALAVTKDGGEINAITGATITSRAVTNGVNAAASYVAELG